MRSIARMEEELSRGAEKKSRGALWKRHPRRGVIIRARIVYERSSSVVSSMQKMQQKGMSCRGEQRARSDIKQEVRRNEMVRVYGGGSAAQKGKGAAKQHMVRRTRKCSKRGG